MDYRKEFISIYKENIKREGADKLLDWILSTDFFDAPASIRFHSAHVGGLCEHCVKVYKRFKRILICEFGQDYQKYFDDESVAVCALLHDLCKINFYKTEMRNVKVDGVWEQKPFYIVDDKLPYGHGEKSVYIINGFMRLTREEAIIINWHMGEFDARVKGGSYSLVDAYYKYPITLLFHTADIFATYFDEDR